MGNPGRVGAQDGGHVGAESMVNYLEQNRPDQCRDHPDAPGVKDTSLSCPLESHDQKNVRMGHFIIPYWCIYIYMYMYIYAAGHGCLKKWKVVKSDGIAFSTTKSTFYLLPR